ncbi:TolC family protein [Pelagovum pacificum]|uniref:TolC family protein n=1 Tax=Pelagovum pacificum TaxID=2588711 RepID=A0A5C5G7P8_9RHOB|nr:TolC family protein [Pelagovum pacificum]QQA41861.1 TolC family protein [Pelagovum pacificum]TNY30696.1 TolC family protein [Pelagovum pacificum]
MTRVEGQGGHVRATWNGKQLAVILAVGALLSGCAAIPGPGEMVAATRDRVGFGRDDAEAQPVPASATANPAALDANMADGTASETIEGLLTRRTVLQPGPLASVADAVLAANSRTAEAELRAATLRAEAAQLNWLPTLGPQISLSSLGDVVSSLVVDAVLFDNGGKIAERDYARADVEVAAVALAQDTNERVLTALELYLRAEAARERAAVSQNSLGRMERFLYVMDERMAAGISDRADQQLVAQKVDRMRSEIAADLETAATAMNELQAMAAVPVQNLSGVSPVSQPDPLAVPLDVLKAQAEASRAVAEAAAARAGQLPGLNATGTISSDGNSGGLVAGGDGIGFGLGSRLQALEATREAAQGRVGEAQETANRRISQLSGELASLERQAAEAQDNARAAAENWELFAAQLDAGRRSVPEVVGIFETRVRTEREAVALRYDVALTRARIAEAVGALVDGDKI